MVSILENLYPGNILPGIWQSIGASVQTVFEMLNNSLAETVSSLEELDSKVQSLDADIQSWNTKLATISIPGNISEVSNGATPGITPVSSMYGPKNTNRQEEGGSSFKRGINMLETASKVGEDALDAVGYFVELSPKLKKLKRGLGIVNKIVEGAEGAGEILSAAAGGATVMEGIAAGSEILAGAAGVAEAAVGFGPPGWAIALGALAVGGIADYIMKPKKRHEAAEPSSAPEMEQYYLEKEKEVQRNELIERFHAESSTDRLLVESIVMQPAMIREREQKAVEDTKNASLEYLNIYAPTSDPAKAKMLENNIIVSHPFSAVADKVSAHIFVDNSGYTDSNSKASDTQIKPTSAVTQRVPNAKHAANIKPMLTNRPQPNNYGRVININLNKPMIDHFTINTNGMKEGINDFKLKVEEVLLEILNSANTIN